MKLVVGLGNPGVKYKETRHNVGFMFTDELAKALKCEFTLDKTKKTKIAITNIGNEKVIIIQPQTYMNLSGEAVYIVCKYYQIDTDDIIIIYDDLDLPVGKVRIRPTGSSGGHKGMQNIIDLMKTQDIKRIRIGINGCNKNDVIDYVLGKFTKDEKIDILLATSRALEMIETFIEGKFSDFMSRYN